MQLPKLFITFSVFLSPVIATHAATLTPDEATGHVSENASVCGVVASAKYVEGSRGSPTFLNLGKVYPDHVFTCVIFGSDRAKFGTPEISLRGKQVCCTGKIEAYKGRPEIKLHDSNRLTEK